MLGACYLHSLRRSARTMLLVGAGAVVLASCGGGGGGAGNASPVASGYPNAPVSCDTFNQKSWLRDYINDQYFWHDKQGVANEAAASPAAYLDSLLYKPIDRYSYAQSTAQFTQFFNEGRRTGYGESLVWADATRTAIQVRLIEPLSPLGLTGIVQRGDKVLSIDGYTPVQIASGQLPAVNSLGVARTYVVQTGQGPARSLTVQSADFALSPVIAKSVFIAGSAKVGYLMYQEFISSGSTMLGNAFDLFRAQGVTELILDLRYNGGGSTSQARNLASMAGGSVLDGQVFAHYRYSAKYAANNFSQNFSANGLPALPLNNLNRVFVITSADTASASEMVINALRPFKNVITIGATTFGKPYAFQPRDACGTTYNAVNIEIANAIGFADYSAGIAPTCAMSDDLSRTLGDPAELRTAAALSYITTGSCPLVATIIQANKVADQSKIAQTAINSIANGDANHEAHKALSFGEQGPRQARID